MATPLWVQTVIGWAGKALAGLFAAATVAIGATIAVMVQIGEGAKFSDIETVAWLTIIAAGLGAFGGVLGINANGKSN